MIRVPQSPMAWFDVGPDGVVRPGSPPTTPMTVNEIRFGVDVNMPPSEIRLVYPDGRIVKFINVGVEVRPAAPLSGGGER